MCTIQKLYDLSHTMAENYLRGFTYPWDALKGIKETLLALGADLSPEEYDNPAPEVWIHKSAKVAPTAYIAGPCIVGAESEVRHCAYIRGSALIGKNCVVGNSTELKNVILFDNVQVPHFNYVGDSILGYKAHMGAGSVTSNVRGDKALVTVHAQPPIATGIKKVGAMLGDFAEIGCNSVLNPGTVIGRNTQVYPTTCARGVVPANSIYKTDGTIIPKKE